MKNKFKTAVLVMFLVMIFTFACIDSVPTRVTTEATAAPQMTEAVQEPTEPVQQNDGKVEITSASSYIDSFNDYNVSGEIFNNTNRTLENITLSVSITDESGMSLLKDDDDNPVDHIDIQPYLGVLVSGASSPFNYYISANDVTPAKFDVTIKSYDQSSAPDLADINIQNVQLANTEAGDILITGEVVNKSSEHVDVESMAGAVMDGSKKVLAASSTLTYSRYLYPAGDPAGRDHGPFIVRLYGPIKNMEHWKVYARGVESDEVPSTDMDVQLTSSYTDTYGTYHLLGTVTNNGTSQISPAVIGGLYGSDQTVFDAASLNVPLYLSAGESAPFDINTFQLASSMPADQVSAIEKIVKPDYYWTFTTHYELQPLKAKSVKVQRDGSDWTVKGTVLNTTDKKLGSISAVIEFLDEDQQVIATNAASIYPPDGSDTIDPGKSNEFSVSIYAPEDWNLSSREYRVILQGVVSE